MADVTIDNSIGFFHHERANGHTLVGTDKDTQYKIYVDGDNDIKYSKSTDGGGTWAAPVTVLAGSILAYAVWFDKWTPGDSGDDIHMVYIDHPTTDIRYRSLDTSSDTLSTETTVRNESSVRNATGFNEHTIGITKARGGNLYCAFRLSRLTDDVDFFYRSTDGGSTWTSRASPYESDNDHVLLYPGDETDNQDVWMIFWDISADEIDLKIYDNSGDSWSTTNISTGMAGWHADHLQMSGCVRHSDNHVLLFAHNAYDSATNDLKGWDIGGSGSITALTDVFTNTQDAAKASVLINQQNDDIYVFYCKGTNWLVSVDVHYKRSTDGGTTWGTETQYNDTTDDHRGVYAPMSIDDDGGRVGAAFNNFDLIDFHYNKDNSIAIEAAVSGGSEGAAMYHHLRNLGVYG